MQPPACLLQKAPFAVLNGLSKGPLFIPWTLLGLSGSWLALPCGGSSSRQGKMKVSSSSRCGEAWPQRQKDRCTCLADLSVSPCCRDGVLASALSASYWRVGSHTGGGGGLLLLPCFDGTPGGAEPPCRQLRSPCARHANLEWLSFQDGGGGRMFDTQQQRCHGITTIAPVRWFTSQSGFASVSPSARRSSLIHAASRCPSLSAAPCKPPPAGRLRWRANLPGA